MLFKYLQDLQLQCGLSNTEISDMSGVPKPTVDKVLSGRTDNPTFNTVVDIVLAMNGSIDDIVGILHPDMNERPAPTPKFDNSAFVAIYEKAYNRALESSRSSYQNACNVMERAIVKESDEHQQAMHDKNRWLTCMFIYCILVTVVAILK